jgi:predicted aspartyl protease
MWVAAGVALSADAGAMPLGSEVRRIPARLAAHRLLVVPVTVNGTGPYPFLLDTGATSSVVDERLARDLGLAPAGRGLQETATAGGSVDLVLAALALGRVERRGEVIRASLAAVRAVDPAVRGIVGQDLLRLGNWWLDYRGGSLLEDPDGLLALGDLGERLSVHWLGERPAIDTLLPDRRSLRLVLDSAASSAVMFGGSHPVSAGHDDAEMTTLDDRVTVRLGAVGPLRAGRADVPRFSAALLGDSEGRREDGLLPTALFEGVYFDNRAGAVVLNPRRSALPGRERSRDR